ncbi:MAG: hypothetical protein Athens041674_933 [Parcubacteria group bacterium Athens0416_74]|nr:MAG: hypothetical protein Athens041674_933 [Parcubacteria group bacterium Athens0416_74]
MDGYMRKFGEGERRHPRRKPEVPKRPDFGNLAIEGLRRESEKKKSVEDTDEEKDS